MRIRPITDQTDKGYLLVLLAVLPVAGFVLSLTDGVMRIVCVVLFSAGLALLSRRTGVTAAELGMSKSRLGSGFAWGIGSLALIGIVITLAVIVRPDVFMDERYRQGMAAAAFQALVYIPLATVLFEEFLFRGLLLALLKRHYPLTKSIFFSSLCFGLWHIFTSSGFSSAFFGSDSVAYRILGMLLVFAATFTAGVLLCILRIRYDSLIAPVLAHWALNASAVLAAAVVWNV